MQNGFTDRFALRLLVSSLILSHTSIQLQSSAINIVRAMLSGHAMKRA
jgi:hypothetical protein